MHSEVAIIADSCHDTVPAAVQYETCAIFQARVV